MARKKTEKLQEEVNEVVETPETPNDTEVSEPTEQISDEDIVRALVGDAKNTTLDKAMEQLTNQAQAPKLSDEDRELYNKKLEEAIEDSTLTHEELNEKYAPTIQEGIAFLRSTITSRGHTHSDELFSLLRQFEQVANR